MCHQFILLYLPLVLHQEVDVVQSVHQAMLLVGVDFKGLATTRCLVGHGLGGQIHFHLGFGIGGDAFEQFLQKALAHHNGQHEVVQLVVLVDIGKEAGDNHAEAIPGDGPGSMFAAGARAEVLTGHEDAATVGGVVQHKVLVQSSISIVAPVAEEVVAEELLLAGGGFEETSRDDLVGIYVLQREGRILSVSTFSSGRVTQVEVMM